MRVHGVILAGGRGTRLGDLTRVTNKHLLPIGPNPMICYPLHKLVGIETDGILLVTGPEHLGAFATLLGSGHDHGCRLTYRVQDEPGGIAQALALAEGFSRNEHSLVILGDNIFFDPLGAILSSASARPDHAWVLLKRVPDPQRYGVAQVKDGMIVDLQEKPLAPQSDLAVTGIYLYPPDVFSVIRTLRPSARGELEITDVNRHYLEQSRLSFREMDGYWTDAGTLESLATASRLVEAQPPLS
jgi:glucose-1-phosphate thymidylyltransferase